MSNQYIEKPYLDGSSFIYPGNKTGFVLVHGFTATTTEVRPLAERLHQEGYTVSAPLLPGHDTHPDDLNKVSWQDWYQTVKSVCAKAVTGFGWVENRWVLSSAFSLQLSFLK